LDLEDADEIALAGRELLIQRFGTGTVVSQYFDALRALVDGTSPSIPNKDRLLGAVDRLAEKLPRHDERAAGAVDTLDAASKVIADPPVRMYLKLRRLLSPSWPHRNLRSDSSSKDE
jgi:hypothetical protein